MRHLINSHLNFGPKLRLGLDLKRLNETLRLESLQPCIPFQNVQVASALARRGACEEVQRLLAENTGRRGVQQREGKEIAAKKSPAHGQAEQSQRRGSHCAKGERQVGGGL